MHEGWVLKEDDPDVCETKKGLCRSSNIGMNKLLLVSEYYLSIWNFFGFQI
jgi:hypothetical protein